MDCSVYLPFFVSHCATVTYMQSNLQMHVKLSCSRHEKPGEENKILQEAKGLRSHATLRQ